MHYFSEAPQRSFGHQQRYVRAKQAQPEASACIVEYIGRVAYFCGVKEAWLVQLCRCVQGIWESQAGLAERGSAMELKSLAHCPQDFDHQTHLSGAGMAGVG